MERGKRYRIVMDPARWGKRTGPRKNPTNSHDTTDVGGRAEKPKRDAALLPLHITSASKRAACLLDWDRIADLLIKDAEARRRKGDS